MICEVGLFLLQKEQSFSRFLCFFFVRCSLLTEGRSNQKQVDLAFVSADQCSKIKFGNNCSADGTFVLSHDDPLSHSQIRFFDWIDLKNTFRLLPQNVVSIGLCSKSNHGCNDTQFLSLSDSVIDALSKEAAKFGVRLFLDGSFTDVCLGDRWPQFSRTWQGQPLEALWTNKCGEKVLQQATNFFLCSSNFLFWQFCDLYQIFDTPILNEPNFSFFPFREIHYGKFGSQTECKK